MEISSQKNLANLLQAGAKCANRLAKYKASAKITIDWLVKISVCKIFISSYFRHYDHSVKNSIGQYFTYRTKINTQFALTLIIRWRKYFVCLIFGVESDHRNFFHSEHLLTYGKYYTFNCCTIHVMREKWWQKTFTCSIVSGGGLTFEKVGLLSNGVLHHFPELFRHSVHHVASGKLVLSQHSIPGW